MLAEIGVVEVVVTNHRPNLVLCDLWVAVAVVFKDRGISRPKGAPSRVVLHELPAAIEDCRVAWRRIGSTEIVKVAVERALRPQMVPHVRDILGRILRIERFGSAYAIYADDEHVACAILGANCLRGLARAQADKQQCQQQQPAALETWPDGRNYRQPMSVSRHLHTPTRI